MIPREEFLKKYNINETDFVATGLAWADLEAIYSDHEAKQTDLLAAGNLVAEHLRQIPQIHSLKIRVKDPEHLVEKIIRKKIKEPDRTVTLENYETEITDLVGVRALHLFKEDWFPIHDAITAIWDNYQTPVANIRKGDPEDFFKERGLMVSEHPAGYRSVHYTVKSQPTKQVLVVEIQVRTIFEEGWSEIDHQLRYPYEVDNVILCNYLSILNRFAGAADEMGSFIKWLKRELEKREAAYKTDIETYETERAEMIQNLESVKKELNAESAEREKLQKTINSLQAAKPPSPPPNSIAAAGLSGFTLTQTCEGCGGTYNPGGVCPRCMNSVFAPAKCRECGKSIEFGLSLGSSDLCLRCQTFRPLATVGNPTTCRKCGRSLSISSVIFSDGVCELCRATAL